LDTNKNGAFEKRPIFFAEYGEILLTNAVKYSSKIRDESRICVYGTDTIQSPWPVFDQASDSARSC
jgi:hypothetical protein